MEDNENKMWKWEWHPSGVWKIYYIPRNATAKEIAEHFNQKNECPFCKAEIERNEK